MRIGSIPRHSPPKRSDRPVMPITLACNAMGTRFELVLAGDDETILRPIGETALAEIEDCHRRLNLFDPGSWLNTINRRAAHESVALDDMTYDLLRICVEVNEASGGAFDVTVAPMMRAWGFHGGTGPSDMEAIGSARDQVGMQHVQLDHKRKTIRFTRPGVTLDLGGIAKGFAIDRAVERLREEGVTRALLHGGTSTVAAVGAPPNESGWRVSLPIRNGEESSPGGDGCHISSRRAKCAVITHFAATRSKCGTRHGWIENTPINRTDQPSTAVMLNDGSLSISAPHGRTIESGDARLGHVFDPRTGKPAQCGSFAGAIGESACLTDAWATALLVLGIVPPGMPDAIRAVLPRHPPHSSFNAMPLEASTI